MTRVRVRLCMFTLHLIFYDRHPTATYHLTTITPFTGKVPPFLFRCQASSSCLPFSRRFFLFHSLPARADRNPSQYQPISFNRRSNHADWTLISSTFCAKNTAFTHAAILGEIRIACLVGDFVTLIRFKRMSIDVDSYLL